MEEKGCLFIRYLWTQGTDSICDMPFMNTGTVSYHSKTPEECLKTAKREKKKKYLHACLNQFRKFSPLVTSVDVLLGFDAEATFKRIASHLAQKCKELYPCTYRYVKSRLAITRVRATHHCIRGGRVPASCISVTRPQWEDGAGPHLLQ